MPSQPPVRIPMAPGAINLTSNDLQPSDIITIVNGGTEIAQVTLEQLGEYFMVSPSLTLTAAVIDISSSGNNTVIAGVPGKQISVHRMILTLESPTTVEFKSGLGIPLSGPQAFTSLLLDTDVNAWYLTAVGDAFTITLADAIQCSGTVWYQLL